MRLNPMAALRHPSHEHPVEPVDSKNVSLQCDFCLKELSDDDAAYACWECDFHLHRRCAEAPLQIECHPFHPLHPLSLVHDRLMRCDACKQNFHQGGSSFSCDECCFDLDLQCALSTLPTETDQGGPLVSDLDLEHVASGLHPHELTPFFAKWTIDLRCVLCTGFIEGDGYICLHPRCKFLIHKRCVQDLYCEDGTMVPRVYHEHPLAIFTGEEVDSIGAECTNCQSERTGEYIGCTRCKSFVHRDCSRVPEILKYPPHPDHALILFIARADNPGLPCRSCSCPIQGELCYRCFHCDFQFHIGCAFQTLAYYKDGMIPEIELSWHNHPLLLSHRAKPFFDSCSCCGDEFHGPAYVCGEEDCGLMLHKQCTDLAPRLDHHPHHPGHPLTLLAEESEGLIQCAACCSSIEGFSFSCELCEFYLHVNCASRIPTTKHYFHEHDLVHFEEISSAECNRCRKADDSPIFRCILCNFNLHEKCMELPRVVKHETHFHELTLREYFMEDDTGEYYCDLCEKRRDGRLGVYVCGECQMERPWAFHIECVLPEIRRVYEKEDNTIALERLDDEIARREEQVRATERKLDEMKQELEELRKKRAAMTLE